jgi:hypothetical protein
MLYLPIDRKTKRTRNDLGWGARNGKIIHGHVKIDIGHPVSKGKFRTLVKVNLGRRTSR